MSKKLFSFYSSWREKKQYSTQISQNETNNETFDILIEEEQRKSNDQNKLINEEDINLDCNFEYPEVKVNSTFEKIKKKKLISKLIKLFAMSFSILLILFICTLIIFLSFIFISNYNRPIHYTIADNTELNEQHADYQFYDIYLGKYPNINVNQNETNYIKPYSFTKDQSEEVIEFFAVSDFHMDLTYDSNLACKGFGEQEKRHKGDTGNYKLGQYNCDTPESLLISLFKKMISFKKNPDFILFTGDIIKHGDLNKTEYLHTFDKFKTNYLKYFPDTLFLPVVGNHDFYPRKSYVEIKDNNENLEEIANAITFSLPSSAVDTFKQGGFYSYLLPSSLSSPSSSSSSSSSSSTLLISLNNIIYSPDWAKGCKKEVGSKDKCAKQRGKDPFGQFDWLNDQLKSAKKSGYKVMIAMHYGMGTSRGGDPQWEDSFQDTFIDLLTKYQDTITIIISGHSHRDLFRLLPDFLKNKIAVLENSSLTPIDGANPSFRYMYLNSTTSQIIDYQHAYFDLSSFISHEIDEGEAWKMEYEFEEQYNVKPTAQGYIHIYNELFISEFDSDNSYSNFLYNQILKYYPSSSSNDAKKTEKEFLCSISNVLNADSVNCLENNSDDDDDDQKKD